MNVTVMKIFFIYLYNLQLNNNKKYIRSHKIRNFLMIGRMGSFPKITLIFFIIKLVTIGHL